jgi:TonB family protein
MPISSFGSLVFWDDTATLTPAETRHILRHELAHVRQGHTWERLALEVLRAILWFNPFVHLLPRALELTHEYLADEEALKDISASDYAALLARQAAARLGFTPVLTHSFIQSFTLNRIAMLYRTSPGRRWKQWLALPLAAVLFLTVACERSTELVAPTADATGASVKHMPVPPPPPPPADEPVPPPPPPPAPVPDKIYERVEEMPAFPTGNNNDIVTYIQSKLKYPAEAVRNKVKGRVIISFVIDKEGNVTDAFIEKGIGSGCDQAALNAVRQLPQFAPGKQDGQPVAVRFVIPIQFEPYSAPISNLLGSLAGSPKC